MVFRRSALMAFMLSFMLGSVAYAQLPPPLPYVQNLEPVEGKTLILKQMRCTSNKPDIQARLYLRRNDNGLYQVARYEYNEQGKYILEHVKEDANGYKYLDRYINQQQPMSLPAFNAMLGLWKLFGYHFTLDKVNYSCQVR